MLALKAPPLGITPVVFSASHKDPAAQVCPQWIQGRPEETHKLKPFLKKIQALTFESELVPALLVQKALPKNLSLHIAPSLKILSQIQDRLHQKELLKTHKLPSPDFVSVSFSNKLPENLKTLYHLRNRFGPFVLKARQGGYDGYGTFPLKTEKQIKAFKAFNNHYIAEAFIPFKRELAILAVRNKTETVLTPLVETHQEHSRCLWVCGPKEHEGFAGLKRKITRFLNALDYQGLMAFELFDKGQSLLVNELAPRVHNSGHYSLNAMSEDQFTLHIKGVFNLPLRPPTFFKGFAMLNLLSGREEHQWEALKREHFHWYGKTPRKGRKMGHVNALGDTPQKALKKLLIESKK